MNAQIEVIDNGYVVRIYGSDFQVRLFCATLDECTEALRKALED